MSGDEAPDGTGPDGTEQKLSDAEMREGCLILLVAVSSLLSFPVVFVFVTRVAGTAPQARGYVYAALATAFFGSVLCAAVSWYVGHRRALGLALPFAAVEGVLGATLLTARAGFDGSAGARVAAAAMAMAAGLAACRLMVATVRSSLRPGGA